MLPVLQFQKPLLSNLAERLNIDSGDYNSIVVLGPTASGKTALAVSLAKQYNGEIISADSRQVYRGMDIGTGKDREEYGSTPVHLLDICNPKEEYNVFHFQRDAYRLFEEIQERNRLPIIAGGTGLYIDAVVNAYDLVSVPKDDAFHAELAEKSLTELREILFRFKKRVHNTTDLEQPERLIRAIEIARYIKSNPDKNHPERPNICPLILGVFFERSVLRDRIMKRLKSRIDDGLIEEVEGLHAEGVSWERLDSFGLEYRFTTAYINGEIQSKEEYIRLLHQAICRFAKRQVTWFRRMERNGTEIIHINPEEARFSSLFQS